MMGKKKGAKAPWQFCDLILSFEAAAIMFLQFFFRIAIFLALCSSAFAENQLGEKAHEAAQGAKHAAHVVGKEIRAGAHNVARFARKTSGRVFSRCPDGRHAVRRSGGCGKHVAAANGK